MLSEQRGFGARLTHLLCRAYAALFEGYGLVSVIVVLVLACRKSRFGILSVLDLRVFQWLSHSELGHVPFRGRRSCGPRPGPRGADALSRHDSQYRVELVPCFRTGWLRIL